jgi:hypothetical protein
VVGLVQESGDAVVDDLGQAADVGRDDRDLGAHRLERDEPEALGPARQQEHVGERQQLVHHFLVAEEQHVTLDAEIARELLGPRFLGTVADHHELRPYPLAHLREYLNHGGDVLDLPEVGGVHDDARLGWREPQRCAAAGMEHLRIDEVVDDLDRPRDAERLLGALLEEAAHRGDAVARLDAELRHPEERRLHPDDGDVRAVQRRDDADRSRQQQLPREVGARRERHRVVHVQQVERIVLDDLDHLGREREIARRLIEHRIRRRRDFVEVDVRLERAQAKRQAVRDEVDLEAAPRELAPELRRDDAAAAEVRVAHDADLLRTATARRALHARGPRARGSPRARLTHPGPAHRTLSARCGCASSARAS